MRKIFIGVMAVCIGIHFISCDTGDDIFNPDKRFLELVENSTVISDMVKEKMAHSSLLYLDNYLNDGTMWVAHMCDETTSVESPDNTTTYSVLRKFNISDFNKIDRWPIAYANTGSNGIAFGNRPPYDPNILIHEDTIQLFFMPLVNNQTTIVCKTFDKKSMQVQDDAQVLKIKYRVNGENKIVDCNDSGVTQCAIDLEYDNTAGVSHIIFASHIIESDGYFYGTLCGFFGICYGLILRSTDGITWELVTVQPNDIRVSEAQIAIVDSTIYYIARSNTYGQCYLGKYDMTKDQWSDVIPIQGSIASRPEIFCHKNKLYVMYNANKPIGQHPRSCVTIQKVDMPSLTLTEKVTIQYIYGIHYFSVAEYNDELYMTFSEDRRQLTNHATNISFTKIEF